MLIGISHSDGTHQLRCWKAVRFTDRTDSVVVGSFPSKTQFMPPTVTFESTSRFVDTKKWRIHLHEAGSGQAIVFLHGSGPGASGWSNFQTNIGPLSENFRVLAVDMPGWGASDSPPPADRDHVEALLLLLDELGIEKAALVGNSMGGMTSIRAAVEHPSRVSHLITMGAPAPGQRIFSPGGWSEGMKVLIGGYEDPSQESFKKLVSVMAFDPKFASDELAAERSRNALAQPEHLKNFLEGIGKGFMNGPMAAFGRTASQLASITAPTLILHGRDDRTVHFENGLQLVASIPNARLVLVNRCGHWIQLEHADEFNRTVSDFVRNA
jgi:2-hydroxy-6-oxonona-2,4-dienedioate hydrolase